MQERCVLDPVEFIPERVQLDLDSLGLEVRAEGVDWGEAAIEAQMVRQAEGETSSDGHRPGVPIRIPIRVKEEGDISLAETAHKLQQKLGTWQTHGGWIGRYPDDRGGFAGALGYRIIRHTAQLSGLQGWLMAHRQDAPDVVLTATRMPIGYRPDEVESATVTEEVGRELIYTLPASEGTAEGLKEILVKNLGSVDWRGLIWAEECEDYQLGPTNELAYAAAALTPKGGAKVTAATPPKVRAVGAVTSGEGAISPGLPAGTKVGDLLIMVAESGGATAAAEANTALTAAGWTSPPAPYAAQKKGNTRLTILYRIATGTDPTTTNDTGDHQVAKIIGIEVGTFDPASPFNVAAVGTQAATKAVSIPGASTTRDNCLILACSSGHLPDAAGTAEFGAATNASLSELTERIDNTVTAGDGGALYAVSGVKATKGVYSTTTCTAVTEAERGVISLAINGLAVVEHSELTAGWLTVLDSEIVGVGHMTHRGVRRPWLRAEDTGSTAGDVELRIRWRTLGALRWSEDNAIVPSPLVDAFQWLDMGECRPQLAALGDERWQFQVQARAPGGSGAVRLHRVCPAPTEQYAALRAPAETQAADIQSTKSAGSGANAGAGLEWKESSKITASDNVYATVTAAGYSEETRSLQATNFGFVIPGGATVVRIVVSIKRKASNSEFGLGKWALDSRVQLLKAGTLVGSNLSASGTPWPVANTTASYGEKHAGGGKQWGETWTPAEVNSSQFGVALQAKVSETTASVDHFAITVYFTEEADETKVCFASRSLELCSAGVYRQHPTDDVWGGMVPDGFLPVTKPGGLEGKPSRGILIPSQGDLGALADAGSSKLSAVGKARDGYHFAREAS